jgi:hypothetical protein
VILAIGIADIHNTNIMGNRPRFQLSDALLVGVTLCQQGAQRISGMLALLNYANRATSIHPVQVKVQNDVIAINIVRLDSGDIFQNIGALLSIQRQLVVVSHGFKPSKVTVA